MLRRWRARCERGDTVVEVLICIAIISLILGGAFVLMNRSLQAERQAQERLNGIKLVEGQLEQLKYIAATNPDAIFASGVPASYCIDTAGAVVDASTSACTVGVNGNPTTSQPSFQLSITKTTVGSLNTFTVTNNWTSVRGTPNNIVMKYRLYQ